MGKFVTLPLEYFVIEYQSDVNVSKVIMTNNKSIGSIIAQNYPKLGTIKNALTFWEVPLFLVT